MTEFTEKAEVLSGSFTLVFIDKTSTEQSQALKMNGNLEQEGLSLGGGGLDQGAVKQIRQTQVHGIRWLTPTNARELALVIARPCSVILERSGQLGGSLEITRSEREIKQHPPPPNKQQ